MGDSEGDGVEAGVEDGNGRDSFNSSKGSDDSLMSESVSDSESDNLAMKSSSPWLSSPMDISLSESPPSSVKSVGAAVRERRRRREKNMPIEKDMGARPSSSIVRL